MAERSADMQLSLSFLEDPIPENGAWERLSVDQQKVAIDVLARLIAQVVVVQQDEEQDHD